MNPELRLSITAIICAAVVVLLPPATVLFQSNPHELAARPHTCFLEQLLESGFHRTFRDFETRTNFLIAEPLKHALQYLTLSFGEGSRGTRSPSTLCCLDQRLDGALIQPGFSCHDLANCLLEEHWRTVLWKNSSHTEAERLYGFGITHARGDHEESSLKAPLPGLGNELEAPLFPEVIVQQDEINWLPA